MNSFQPSESLMRRALELARKAPRAPFGAVIAHQDSGTIVAEGWNRAQESPIWHGEIDAIHRCALVVPKVDWTELTLYTTAEPCPMCQSAILWARIPRVVFGTSIDFLRSKGWSQIAIPSVEVVQRAPGRTCHILGGFLEQECNALYEQLPSSEA